MKSVFIAKWVLIAASIDSPGIPGIGIWAGPTKTECAARLIEVMRTQKIGNAVLGCVPIENLKDDRELRWL